MQDLFTERGDEMLRLSYLRARSRKQMQIINGMPAFVGEHDNWGFACCVDCSTADLLLVAPDGGPDVGSFFGGTVRQDPGDNGETACGDRTRNEDGSEHHIPGFSLPTNPQLAATAGSPIPPLPCHILIRAYAPSTGRTVTAPKIDEGPTRGTGHAIDCTRKTFADLGGDLGAGLLRVRVRILGGAHYLTAAQKGVLAAAGYTLPGPAPGVG